MSTDIKINHFASSRNYKNKKSLLSFLYFFILLALLIMLIVNKRYSLSLMKGIEVFILYLLPTLLPYMFITSVMNTISFPEGLSKKFSPLSKKLFGLESYTFYALFISMLCGYPMGAKMCYDLSNKYPLTQNEKQKLSVLLMFSSPSYLISSVGTVAFNNVLFGVTLYFIHVFSCFLTSAIMFVFMKNGKRTTLEKATVSNDALQTLPQPFNLYDSVYGAVTSCFTIGGIIAIFSVLIEIADSFNLFTPFIALFNILFKNTELARGLAIGLLECTTSIKILSSCTLNFFSLPVLALISGFGGLSVIFQCVAFLKKAKIKTAPFVISKLLCAVISFFVAMPFSMLFV